MNKFTDFLNEDTGAITIDWVALTAGILLLGMLAVFSIFNNGVSPVASEVNSTLSTIDIDVPSTALSL
jgi:Flp pilus assembly pilin Flp